MSDKPKWLPLTAADLPAVDAIADLIHPTLPERSEVYAEKLRLFPDGCRKLMRGPDIVGYGVAHPWKTFSVPLLDTFFGALPDNADCLYIHDVAILPQARGHNASGAYMDYLRPIARQKGFDHIALVSVYGTYVMWQRHGLQITPCPDLQQKYNIYGAEAKYMMVSDADYRTPS